MLGHGLLVQVPKWAGGGLAPSPVRVEEPEQRQTTAQKASYAALFRNMCASGGGNACKPGGVEMRMLKTQLVQDVVFIVEPTMHTKVAWARPECAGRNTNSKSTCEVHALRTVGRGRSAAWPHISACCRLFFGAGGPFSERRK